MTAFLTAHGRRFDPALPDGNCLFRALSKQMTGDPSRHPELREILTTLISKNTHIFGRGWTLQNCSLDEHIAKVTKLGQYGTHAEIKAAASLCQKPIYVATDSLNIDKCMWTVFTPFQSSQLNVFDTWKTFISQPKQWYEIAYIHGCHYDGTLPLRTDIPLRPPPLAKETPQDVIYVE